MIKQESIDRIRESVDIYDVVSSYVHLKKSGSNWKGLSPFTHEKTPSFFVVPAKRIFHCFSSGKAGDVIRFVQLVENVSFVDAVEMLGRRFGIPILYEQRTGENKRAYTRRSLYDLHERACQIFEENFQSSTPLAEKMRHYWEEGRQFPMDVAKEYQIGFGGTNGAHFVKRLLQDGFSVELLKESGLFYSKEDEKDPMRFGLRFLGRLVIPIRDIQGRIVGFSARYVEGITPPSELADAKYINSPETEIFHKGSLLFGMDRARQHLQHESDPIWLVEGQFDAIRCWTNGILTAVAPQGTAITDTQLEIIRRYTPRIHCMLDGDAAGIKAAERMLPMAMAAGLDVRFFILPAQNDPDSYFRNDFSARFQKLLASGEDSIEFLYNRWLRQKNLSPQERASTLMRIYEIVALAESAVAKEGYMRELAKWSGIDSYALWQDFNGYIHKQKFTSSVRDPIVSLPAEAHKKLDTAEGVLLGIVENHSEVAQAVVPFLNEPFMQALSTPDGHLLQKVLNEMSEGMWEGSASINNDALFSEDEKNRLYALLAEEMDDDTIFSLANECLKKLFLRFLHQKMEVINTEIARSLKDTKRLTELMSERSDLKKKAKDFPKIAPNGNKF